MNAFKNLLLVIVAQLVVSMGALTYVVMQTTRKDTCIGDDSICQGLSQSINEQVWLVVGMLAVFSLVAGGFAFLAYRLKNRIMAGVIMVFELLASLNALSILFSAKGSIFVNIVVAALAVGGLILAVVATFKKGAPTQTV